MSPKIQSFLLLLAACALPQVSSLALATSRVAPLFAPTALSQENPEKQSPTPRFAVHSHGSSHNFLRSTKTKTLPVNTSWLNRAWSPARNPTGNRDEGQYAVTLNMYNGLSPSDVQKYTSQGRYVICYTSGGQIFDYERDTFADVPVTTKDPIKDGFPGRKWWVDFTQDAAAGKKMVDWKIQQAKELGCDAIEWDNVDCWEYDTCHPNYKVQDAGLRSPMRKFVEWIGTTTRAAGLQVGLKNQATLLMLYPRIADKFDFSVIENCNNYCFMFEREFIRRGKAVLHAQNVNFNYCKGRSRSSRTVPIMEECACNFAMQRKFTMLVDMSKSGWEQCTSKKSGEKKSS